MGRGLLNGRVAIITGAGQGLGQAVSREFADEGASVALIERNPNTLEAVASELQSKNFPVRHYAIDITDHEAYRTVVEDVAQAFGHIDTIVSNAAIIRYGTVLEDSLEDWRAQIAVNLEAVYMGAKLVAPYMVKQKFGRIINIASIQGFMASGGNGAYNAAKGGVIALTKSMAIELGIHGIAVNAVAPGFMRTPMSIMADGVDETTTEDFQKWYVEKHHVPMARTGYPEDVAGTVVFLASDYCRYMTGEVLVVDGGLTSMF